MIGTSPGKIGTAVGRQRVRSIMAFCDSPMFDRIEACIEFTPNLVTETGDVTVESTAEFLRTYLTEFHGHVTRVDTALPRTTA